MTAKERGTRIIILTEWVDRYFRTSKFKENQHFRNIKLSHPNCWPSNLSDYLHHLIAYEARKRWAVTEYTARDYASIVFARLHSKIWKILEAQ